MSTILQALENQDADKRALAASLLWTSIVQNEPDTYSYVETCSRLARRIADDDERVRTCAVMAIWEHCFAKPTCDLSFLGKAKVETGEMMATMKFRFDSEFPPIVPLRLKVEINCREHFSVLGYEKKKFSVFTRSGASRERLRRDVDLHVARCCGRQIILIFVK